MSTKIKFNISVTFIILYLGSYIIEGPIRYILHSSNLEWMIYFRDLIVVALIFFRLLNYLMRQKIRKIDLGVFIFFLIYVVVGVIYVGDILQVAFGIKIFLPIIVGMMYYNEFTSQVNTIKPIFLIFFIITAIGIMLEYKLEQLPWAGLGYDISGVQIEGSREWSTSGVPRLAGFARSSFDAAIQILFLMIFLLVFLKNRFVHFIIWTLAGLSIFLTTTKGVALAYIIVSILFLLLKIRPRSYKIYLQLAVFPVSISALIGFLVSAFDGTIVNGFQFEYDVLYGSFQDRLSNVWPLTLSMIAENGNVILGRGIGGIGAAQKLFEAHFYTPADNLGLYLYGTFGVPAIIYLFFLYWKLQHLKPNQQTEDVYIFLLLIATFTYGIVVNTIENGFLAFFIGLILNKLHIIGSNWSSEKF